MSFVRRLVKVQKPFVLIRCLSVSCVTDCKRSEARQKPWLQVCQDLQDVTSLRYTIVTLCGTLSLQIEYTAEPHASDTRPSEQSEHFAGSLNQSKQSIPDCIPVPRSSPHEELTGLWPLCKAHTPKGGQTCCLHQLHPGLLTCLHVQL